MGVDGGISKKVGLVFDYFYKNLIVSFDNCKLKI